MTIVDQWKEFKLERLTSDAKESDGERKPLGIVMAFAETVDTEGNSNAYEMMSAFIQGARGEGYTVLIVNNVAWSRKQSIVKPKMDTSDGLIWTFSLPWLDQPLAKNSAEPVSRIAAFSQQYDFIILGLENHSGLFNIDLCEEPVFFNVANLVDRFVFPCNQVIPPELQHKAVTYVPARIHASDALGLISFDADLESASVMVVENTGRPVIHSNMPFKVAHPNIPPVAFQKTKGSSTKFPAYQKVSFGALLGLVPQKIIYCDKELSNYYKEDNPVEGIIGWGATIVAFSAINIPIIMSGFYEALALSATMGAVPALMVGYGGASLYDIIKRRSKKFTDKCLTQELPDVVSTPLIEATKYFPEITSSSSDSQEQPDHSPKETYSIMNPAVNVKTTKRLYDQSIHRYNEIRDRWLDYELDIIKFLDAPLMRDLTYEPTAQFFTHMHRTQNLAEILSQSTDYDADIVDRFESFVAEMSLAFERAESAAVQTGADFLAPDKRKEFETATRLLTLANSESASPSERSSSLDQGRKMLNKSGVTAPAVIYGLLEGKIRMIEPSRSDQETDVQA